MKQVIKFQSSKEHYDANACVVWCFDDRFTGLLGELNKFGYKNIDLIKVAGGALNLTDRVSNQAFDFVADQIEKSIKLHSTPLVILMVHQDCGAYKALGALPSNEHRQTELLSEDLRDARQSLLGYLAEKDLQEPTVKIYIADFDGLWEV